MTPVKPLEIHPYVEAKFKEHASLFYLHVAFEKLPFAEAEYAKRGISDEIYGFRHKVTGQTVLLADTGLALRANGDNEGVCGKAPTSDGFVTTFLETPTHYIGHPIIPYGKCEPHTVSLEKAKWECVLQKGDYLLDLHIPKDGDFSLISLQESYQMARTFFTEHFPEYHLKGLYCGTWLFTPQLQEFLAPTSKIVAFQRSFYLYPSAGSKNFIWNFVFNELLSPEEAVATTHLQKQLLQYVLEDKELFNLKGIYLDVSGDFGTYSYMDAYDKILE